MAKKVPLDKQVPMIREALDGATAEYILKTQKKVGVKCPKDTGRAASSWFIGKGIVNNSVRPEGWAEPGAKKLELPAFPGKITFGGDWFISNSLPYAARICFDARWSKGGGGGAAWFTSIANQLGNDWDKIVEKRLKAIQ